MENQTKETIIIDDTEALLSNLKENYPSDDKLIMEYNKLFDNYKKLNQEYNTIRESQNKYLSRNGDLKNLTKKKVFENASSIIELKEKYNEDINIYRNTIENLKEEIKTNNNKINNLDKELKNSKKEVINLKEINKELESKIKNLEEFNIPFETLLKNEIDISTNNKEPLVLAIIGIYDFANLRDKIKEFTTMNNFILGIFKYLVNNLKEKYTVKFIEVNMFYILMPNTTDKEAYNILEQFSASKSISNNNISLSSGFTTLRKNDTVNIMIERCSLAYNESVKDTRHALAVRR